MIGIFIVILAIIVIAQTIQLKRKDQKLKDMERQFSGYLELLDNENYRLKTQAQRRS